MPACSYSQIETWLRNVYAGLPNHNYGWWLTTREHPDVATLVTACEFLYTRFGEGQISLSNNHYNDLQVALRRQVPTGGARVVINRHLLLNMWRPWRLLRRQDASQINPFQLTQAGLQLARGGIAPREVLESILRELRFVHHEWTRPDVATKYAGISVHPFRILSIVLRHTSNYLNRDEYRLFLARLRTDDDSTIQSAIDFILGFRQLSPTQVSQLVNIEPNLFPNPKTYYNWVDMDLHTFSLFGAGQSFRRVDTTLVVTGTPSAAGALNTFVVPTGIPQVAPPAALPRRQRQRLVNLHEPSANPELDVPPSPDVQVNNWQEAEDFVAQLLSANNFEVRDFSRLRSYGFDLWAQHAVNGAVYYVEVKSSLGRLSTMEFTRLELEAAQRYRDRYLLVCIENWNAADASGDVYVVQDPWAMIPTLQIPRPSTTFTANRSEWMAPSGRFPSSLI